MNRRIVLLTFPLLLSLMLNAKKSDLSFKIIKKRYQTYNAWGMHTCIDLHDCNPEIIRSEEKLRDYLIKICTLIDMKRFGDPTIVHFGSSEHVAGFSMTQLIETSLISGHFANATNAAYIDIFSCKPFDAYKAAEFTKEFFGAKEQSMRLLFRK